MNHCVASVTVVVAAGALGRRRHDIDARLQLAERLVDRETRW